MTALIALVDDDAAARRMLRRVLERVGHQVIEAADGASGLSLILEQRPQLVLLDLRMPGTLSGIDVAREVRANPDLEVVRIVVVSASVYSTAHELTERTGCDGFVEKPVDFDELKLTIDRVLAAHHGG